MAKYLNPISEIDSPDSGKIVKPKEAYKIKSEHKFYCPDHDCLDPERELIPSKSKLGNYFFKHKPDCRHEIHPQTLLHKLAVKWFEDQESFEIPFASFSDKIVNKQVLVLETSKTQLEYRKLERIIPDVKLTTKNDFEFAVEIVVTSDLDQDKRKLIKKFNLPTVRLTLSEFYKENSEKCRSDYEFVVANLDRLLTDINLKSWVIQLEVSKIIDKLEFSEKTKSNNTGCMLGLATLGLIYLFNRIKK